MLNTVENLVDEIVKIADLLQDRSDLSLEEAMKLAGKIQHNRVLQDAFMVNQGVNTPVALEKIAMEFAESNAINCNK